MRRIKPLFYAYLIIKNKLRREITQLNDYNGFHNFLEYQDRKEIFIKDDTVYAKLLIKLAVKNALREPYHKYLEARITPKNNVSSNIGRIKEIDNIVNNKFCYCKDALFDDNQSDKKNYFFIFHFIKFSKEKLVGSDDLYVNYRHRKLRATVKEQALAINKIRRSNSDVKNRLVGIDAASAEIGYRPEIFAHAFRYLKKYSYENDNYIINNRPMIKLGFTYHVGEDFMDITDGLRAIDEAVKFLNLHSGDRLGHCLALGIDALEYYSKRGNCVILKKKTRLLR